MDDKELMRAVRRRFIHNNVVYIVDCVFVLTCMLFIAFVAVKVLIFSGVLKVL